MSRNNARSSALLSVGWPAALTFRYLGETGQRTGNRRPIFILM
jgi:hypothetical protein